MTVISLIALALAIATAQTVDSTGPTIGRPQLTRPDVCVPGPSDVGS
jgi:hypothetical protein